MKPAVLIEKSRPILMLVAAIWVIEIVQQLIGHRLNQWFGLEPRSFDGLIGVPAMPLLHGDFPHLLANTPPLIVLGIMGLLIAPRRFIAASLTIVLVSGLAVWLLARGNTIHVGASGLIFGWFGFLLALGWFERSWQAVAGALVVIVLYGGFFWGVLPQGQTGISWEAHLFGALAGAAAAWLYRVRPR